MARAQKIQETIKVRQKVNRIQLTLTEGDADFLQAFLSTAGGSKDNSPRKYAERIARALEHATGQRYPDTDAFKLMRKTGGGISFRDYGDNLNTALGYMKTYAASNPNPFKYNPATDEYQRLR